jgi:hypothetical protein
MKKLIEIQREVETLYIYWTLTDFCNFKCSYCPDDLHAGEYSRNQRPGFPTNEEIDIFLDSIVNKHLQGRFLNMTISGGEPTLHPMFKNIIAKMNPHGSVEVITNGSRSVEWWQDMAVLPNKVTISLHPEFSNLDKINELGLFLLENNIDLMFNLMCDPANWDWVVNVKNLLDTKLHGHINAKILTDHKNPMTDGKPFSYYEDQLAFIKASQSRIPNSDRRKYVYAIYDDGTRKGLEAFAVINNNEHRFTGWTCSAGRSGYRVHFDGYVYAGICSIKKLGKLDNFVPGTTDLVCTKIYCKTPGDINLSKKAPAA